MGSAAETATRCRRGQASSIPNPPVRKFGLMSGIGHRQRTLLGQGPCRPRTGGQLTAEPNSVWYITP